MDFHGIQTEKAKAMARYRRLRNIANVCRIIEIVFALFLVSWSSTRLPNAAKFAAGLVGKISVRLCGFAIFNAIIAFLFVLSRQNHGAEGGGEEDVEPFVFTESDFEFRSPPAPPCEAAEARQEEEDEREKQMVVVENAVAIEECDAVCAAIEEAKKQIRRFERTQSAKLKRELRCHRRLRRSETDISLGAAVDERAISVIDTVGRYGTDRMQQRETNMNVKADNNERAVSVIERVWRPGTDINVKATVEERANSGIDGVDTLSSDEFQRTIDEFIARQQRFLLEQKIAEKQLVGIE